MRVLKWVQARLHGPRCSKRKPEFQYGSPPPADACSSSGPRRSVDELHGGWQWHPAMLSIGTFGMRQGRQDELERMQKELTLLIRAKAVATTMAEDDVEERMNGGIARQRSFRNKLVSSFFSGFFPRQSFRGTTPELRPTKIPWPLLHNEIPAEEMVPVQATIKSYRTAELPWRGNTIEAEQGSKWIRTDSECKFI
ncbi:unnamed protein product [Alopecurus aequalis]